MPWTTRSKVLLGIGAVVAGAVGLGIVQAVVSRRRSSFGGFGKLEARGEGEMVVKGTVKCPVYKSIPSLLKSGGSVTVTDREYTRPAKIEVKCKGEGETRRCTAVYPTCPKYVRAEDPDPENLDRGRVAGLRVPKGVTRGRDQSGHWNTTISWEGKRREEFQLQVWDDRDPGEHLANTVFYDAVSLRRAYPRAPLELERDSWTLDAGPGGRAVLAPTLAEAAAKDVSRWGSISHAELEASPPIRIGGARVDWPRQLTGPGGG